MKFEKPKLFTPIKVANTTFAHRAWVSPMCMYSCSPEKPGVVNDFHLAHYGAFALGGAALIMVEATAVTPEGRITPQCAGIWNEDQVKPWKKVTDFIHSVHNASTEKSQLKVGVQLAHAGRKASMYRQWSGKGSIPIEDGGWQTVGPTAEPFAGLQAPWALKDEEIEVIVQDFAQAAQRSVAAGFDVVEIHAAHGYLIHEFLSPLTNTRDDHWGGSLENRARLLTEILDAVRQVVPENYPIFVRFSGTDWVDGGITGEMTAEYAKLVQKHGANWADISTGGLVPDAKIPVGKNYQVEFAHIVKEHTQLPTSAVGSITEAEQAENILDECSADAVFLGRAVLNDPSWFKHAAAQLKLSREEQLELWPIQHGRGLPQ